EANAARARVPPSARYAMWNRGLQCTPSASSVPPKSSSTTSAVTSAVMRVPAHLHGHHGACHVHLVSTGETHVMEVVLVVKRVARLRGRPCDGATGHEQAAHHAHAAVGNLPAGRVVGRYRHALAVLGRPVPGDQRP